MNDKNMSGSEPEALLRCLDFFASVIKSGERWTDTCQRMYDTARELDAIARKHAAGAVAEPAGCEALELLKEVSAFFNGPARIAPVSQNAKAGGLWKRIDALIATEAV